jgi:ribonuclease P protein component, eubacterial
MSSRIFTLRKSDKICSRSRITQLFSNGDTLFLYPFKLFYAPNNSPLSRFLISVPKKSFKRAVQRNYIKRLVRESLRTLRFSSYFEKGIDICFIYTTSDTPDYTFINTKIENVLDKIKKRVKADSNAATDIIG